ncbi:MAG TPA: glycosyltransferase family 2 protein [Myxococcota bacterium]|nr:glycosyltransferase family 2 protein [Myxococcota bacterium]
MPSLSVILPAYNEAGRLAQSLAQLRSALGSYREVELLVVDDGSTDSTLETAMRAGARVLPLSPNAGKGWAVREGMLLARGERRLICDVDLSTPPDQLEKLWKTLDEGAQVAIGSRSLPTSEVRRRQPWYREGMGRSFNRLVQGLVMPGFIDTQCGFKLFDGEAADAIFRRLKVRGFAFDVEVLVIAAALGYRVEEVPVVWENHPNSSVGLVEDSAKMLVDLGRIAWRKSQGGYP